MDDFDRLLALTRAAENCNGLARQFIEHFGDDPEFSRLLSAPGQPYCQPTADSQAKQHMADARSATAAMREEARRWDQACVAHDAVLRAAVDLRLPVLHFNGSTYPTAHEAARHFAQAVSEVLYRTEGYGDIEHSFELARLLADFRPVPDYYGQIQQESIAAEEFLPATASNVGDDEQEDESSIGDGDSGSRDGRWRLTHEALDHEAGWRTWTTAQKRGIVTRWNQLYAKRPDWVPLTLANLTQLISDRKKKEKRANQNRE